MSFVYDIKKQLVDIGLEFENKFNKKAQTASPAAPATPATPEAAPQALVPPASADASATALRLIEGIKASMEDVYTKDAKDLRSFVNYCLDKKIEREGKRIVYRSDPNPTAMSAGLEMVPEAIKDEYVPYPPEQEAYMVNKAGMIRMIQENQSAAFQAKNRIAEVMFGKLVDEANRDLKLGMTKTKPGTDPNQPAAQPGADGKPVQPGSGDSNQQGKDKGTGTTQPQGQMLATIKSALGGMNPLGDPLDIIIIKRFFTVVQETINDNANKGKFEQMLSAEIGAPIGNPILKEKMQSIYALTVDGLKHVNSLLPGGPSPLAKTKIRIHDLQNSGGTNSVDAFKAAVLQPGHNTARDVQNVANVLSYVINRVYALEDELIQNNSFLTEQQQIFAGWKDLLTTVEQDAGRAAEKDKTR